MSEVNIDADLVRDGGGLSRVDEKLVEMSNGCICCTLREDLLKEVERLALDKKFDYNILIESTGIGEPIPVAQTFSYVDEENDIDLTKLTRLDTMVTVVNAPEFWKDFYSRDSLKDRGTAFTFSQAGSSKQFARAGLWVSALTEEERQYYLGENFEKTPDWRKLPDPFTKKYNSFRETQSA